MGLWCSIALLLRSVNFSNFQLGMAHDLKIGCGQDGDRGFMTIDQSHVYGAQRWSTCSKREFLDNYNLLESIGKWCLAPLSSKPKLECENSGSYKQEDCAGWVNAGFCKGEYEEFMLDHCKKSCGGCDEEGKNLLVGHTLG